MPNGSAQRDRHHGSWDWRRNIRDAQVLHLAALAGRCVVKGLRLKGVKRRLELTLKYFPTNEKKLSTGSIVIAISAAALPLPSHAQERLVLCRPHPGSQDA